VLSVWSVLSVLIVWSVWSEWFGVYEWSVCVLNVLTVSSVSSVLSASSVLRLHKVIGHTYPCRGIHITLPELPPTSRVVAPSPRRWANHHTPSFLLRTLLSPMLSPTYSCTFFLSNSTVTALPLPTLCPPPSTSFVFASSSSSRAPPGPQARLSAPAWWAVQKRSPPALFLNWVVGVSVVYEKHTYTYIHACVYICVYTYACVQQLQQMYSTVAKNVLQHTATHCNNTLQHSCNKCTQQLQHTATYYTILQHTATHHST